MQKTAFLNLLEGLTNILGTLGVFYRQKYSFKYLGLYVVVDHRLITNFKYCHYSRKFRVTLIVKPCRPYSICVFAPFLEVDKATTFFPAKTENMESKRNPINVGSKGFAKHNTLFKFERAEF